MIFLAVLDLFGRGRVDVLLFQAREQFSEGSGYPLAPLGSMQAPGRCTDSFPVKCLVGLPLIKQRRAR